jgi:hypothetical protein
MVISEEMFSLQPALDKFDVPKVTLHKHAVGATMSRKS